MNEEQVLEALREVIDPELGINVVDLGLVYGVSITDDRIDVELTMTSPVCPMGDLIVEEADDVIRRSADGRAVHVALVWEPPWHPGLMSNDARRLLGWE